MAILEQIPEWPPGQPGWNAMVQRMLARSNTIPEISLDALAQKIIAGTGITINYNSATKTFTFTATGSTGFDAEALMDHLAAHLIIDSGGTLTYDDPAGDIHLALTGGGGTGGTDTETVRDLIGSTLQPGLGIALTVNDAADTVTVAKSLPRIVTITYGATITPNADTTDVFKVTLAGNPTIAAPGGTPYAGQKIVGRLKQDPTGSRVPSWNAIYRFSGGATPTLTTAANKTDYLGFMYNTDDSKWDCIAVSKGY